MHFINNKKEIFINGEKTNYLINTNGDIISTCFRGEKNKRGIMKGGLDKDGYSIVSLTHRGKKYIRKKHRLVAEAFIPNPENKPEVNHIE